MSDARITFEALPSGDVPAPSKSDTRAALVSRPNDWAVVYRADRLARAEALHDAIVDGRTYGPHFEAAVRKVGAECRVYARYVIWTN